jgi:hypothetical protein
MVVMKQKTTAYLEEILEHIPILCHSYLDDFAELEDERDTKIVEYKKIRVELIEKMKKSVSESKQNTPTN